MGKSTKLGQVPLNPEQVEVCKELDALLKKADDMGVKFVVEINTHELLGYALGTNSTKIMSGVDPKTAYEFEYDKLSGYNMEYETFYPVPVFTYTY